MKKLILLILAALILQINVVGVSAFSDISDNDYFKDAAIYLDNNEIISGYFDGTFRGNSNITRAEMATIICRYLGKISDADALKDNSPFKDVENEHWALGYINYAYKSGIINGDGNGMFRPEDYVLFEESIKMLLSASSLDKDINWDYNNWKQIYVDTAQRKGVTEGQYGIQGQYVSRADVSVLLYNILTKDGYTESSNEIIGINSAEQMCALSRLTAATHIKSKLGIIDDEEDLNLFSYPENITTKSEKISYLKRANYILEKDIELDFSIALSYSDISEEKGAFFGICVGESKTVFSGKFNGNNKTITLTSSYGIKLENENEYITYNIGLFGKMSDAEVSNLNIRVKGDLKIKSNRNNYVFGILAGEVNNSQIADVNIDITKNSMVGIEQSRIANRNSILGGLIGCVTADKENYIRNCSVSLVDSFLINSKNNESTGNMYTGGIAGRSSGTWECMVKIENCKTELKNSSIVAESAKEISCVGGVVSDSYFTEYSDTDVILYNSSMGAYTTQNTNLTIYKNGMQEYFKYAVGGILGNAMAGSNNKERLGQNGVTIKNCSFKASMDKYGEILYAKEKSGSATNVGGLVGIAFNNLTIESSIVDVKNGNFLSERMESSRDIAEHGATIGGIIGRMEHTGRIHNCVVNGENFDMILRSTEKHIYAGGIVGIDIGPVHKKQISLENNKVIGNGTTDIILEVIKSDNPNRNIYIGGIAGIGGYQIRDCDVSGLSLILNGNNIYEANNVYMGKTAGYITDIYLKEYKMFEWDDIGEFDCTVDNVILYNNLRDNVTVNINEK